MTIPTDRNDTPKPETRCANCGLPFPKPPIREEIRGEEHVFCSETCRDAFHDAALKSTTYHGFKRTNLHVTGIDAQLPDGFPRNSFVLLSCTPGTRAESLYAELLWRALQRNEPVILVTFEEPPISFVEQMLSLDWNVLPYLEREEFRIIDCSTERAAAYNRNLDRLTNWNQYLYRIVDRVTTRVSPLETPAVIHSTLDEVAEEMELANQGLVLFDSLNELGAFAQSHAWNFIKDLRTDLCTGRFVPVFGGATYVFEDEGFPQNLRYIADGIIELNLEFPEDGLYYRKYIQILKMQGVTTTTRRVPYQYERGNGLEILEI